MGQVFNLPPRVENPGHVAPLGEGRATYLLLPRHRPACVAGALRIEVAAMKPASHPLDRGRDFGLLVLRVVVGLAFVYYGWTKIMAGQAKWEGVGSAMGLFGVTQGHLYWGLAASLLEFFGGIALVFGLFVRPAAILLFPVMVVASVLRSRALDFSAGDSVSEMFYPATLAAVMVALFFLGGGRMAALGRGRRTSTVDPKPGT